ncbi:MAG: glycosyltransferase family 4 protein [Hyphomonadaceae bacterium]
MKSLKILAPTRYPWTFNSPRKTRHRVSRRRFAPLNKITWKLEATTAFNPWPPQRFDLIHAFNRIPLGRTPYIISFESHLPRAMGMEETPYFARLTRMLTSERCRGIYAISQHALDTFRWQHGVSGALRQLEPKLSLRYPNLVIPNAPDAMAEQPIEPFVLTFVGGHFARKGGCAAVRLAELALERDIPLQINIISNLEMGGGIWTDPPRPEFYDPYRKRLTLPNVRHFNGLPNSETVGLLARSHMTLLTTFSDSFGYSAIEAMANWTPVLGTNQCALPEFVVNGETGVLLDLPTDELGNWIHSNPPYRNEPRYEEIFAEETERLAQESLAAIEHLMSNPDTYAAMRRAARAKAEAMFNADDATKFWDDEYERASKRGKRLSNT